jgi:putative phosphoesterase
MPTRTLTAHATLVIPDDGTARIAVIADTHSRPHDAIARHLDALRPTAILHAGDIGELDVLEPFREAAPLYVVRGNIDTRAHDLPDALTIDVVAGERAVLRILLVHIGLDGARLRGDVARRARADKASLVVCGHSHVPFIGRERDLTVFNPGSIGPRRFHLPIVFGRIDIAPAGVGLAHVDCETGQPWLPPAA